MQSIVINTCILNLDKSMSNYNNKKKINKVFCQYIYIYIHDYIKLFYTLYFCQYLLRIKYIVNL